MPAAIMSAVRGATAVRNTSCSHTSKAFLNAKKAYSRTNRLVCFEHSASKSIIAESMRGVNAAPQPCIMASKAPMDVSSDLQPSVSGRNVGGAVASAAGRSSPPVCLRNLSRISPSTVSAKPSKTWMPSRTQHSRSTSAIAFRTRYSGSTKSRGTSRKRLSRKPGLSQAFTASAAAARPLWRASQDSSLRQARTKVSTDSRLKRPAAKASRKASSARSRVKFLKSRSCSKTASTVSASAGAMAWSRRPSETSRRERWRC
mmetsp:Transcript_18888/g.54637  ORF Transcript_18888/g.54637 Transcript_18888/m.54637 type:complete len:259 (-) Transcript_18888:26-802(-)